MSVVALQRTSLMFPGLILLPNDEENGGLKDPDFFSVPVGDLFFLNKKPTSNKHEMHLFLFILSGIREIPKGWEIPGLTILFRNVVFLNPKNGNQFMAGICYMTDLIHVGWNEEPGWQPTLERLGEDGNPIMRYQKQDISPFYYHLERR